jgi:hypothetical protein
MSNVAPTQATITSLSSSSSSSFIISTQTEVVKLKGKQDIISRIRASHYMLPDQSLNTISSSFSFSSSLSSSSSSSVAAASPSSPSLSSDDLSRIRIGWVVNSSR